jgi:hypothetical protein
MDIIHELFNLLWYAVGFSYSLFAGLLIWKTHKYLYSEYHKYESIGWRSSYTGLVERALYTGSLLAGYPEFVAVWLTLKSVSHWDRFKADAKLENGEATAKFNGYFIDTGLSIAYGFVGAFIARRFIDHQCILPIGVGVGLIVLHVCLNKILQRKTNKESPSEPKKIIAQAEDKK